MSRYNHFAPNKYQTINFRDIPIGEKFRRNSHNGKIKRKNIIMVKTGKLSCKELKSGKELSFYSTDVTVFSFDLLTAPPQ